jgi:ATPase subunit of ABC transporter with duplicated ATPase domains
MWQDGFLSSTGEGDPVEGNYSSWLEQKARRLEVEEKGMSKEERSLKESWNG